MLYKTQNALAAFYIFYGKYYESSTDNTLMRGMLYLCRDFNDCSFYQNTSLDIPTSDNIEEIIKDLITNLNSEENEVEKFYDEYAYDRTFDNVIPRFRRERIAKCRDILEIQYQNIYSIEEYITYCANADFWKLDSKIQELRKLKAAS